MAPRTEQVHLQLRVDDAIPDSAVMGDPIRLRQVLLNLVSNAVKFTEHGSVTVTAKVRDNEPTAGAGGAVWEFSVEDTGIGIPADKLARIFEPFKQVDGSISRRFGGTGLGLTICARLVEAMGGRIWLESEPGRGTRFYFTAVFRTATLESSAAAAENCLAGVPVFIVETSPSSRPKLGELLLGFGMGPLVFEHVRDALAAIETARHEGERCPIVLLGKEALSTDLPAEIRRRNPNTGIVALTSECESCDPTVCRSTCVDAFVSEPIDESYLERVLRNLVEGLAVLRPTCDQRPANVSLNGGFAGEPFSGPMRILLVEDNPVNQKVAATVLETRGHRVTIAKNGLEAVSEVTRDVFDAVLMDVQMPVMDGWEATAAIRARERDSGAHVPIVAMTAHAFKEEIDRCRSVGMDGYIAKPFQTDDLLKELARVRRIAGC